MYEPDKHTIAIQFNLLYSDIYKCHLYLLNKFR